MVLKFIYHYLLFRHIVELLTKKLGKHQVMFAMLGTDFARLITIRTFVHYIQDPSINESRMFEALPNLIAKTCTLTC